MSKKSRVIALAALAAVLALLVLLDKGVQVHTAEAATKTDQLCVIQLKGESFVTCWSALDANAHSTASAPTKVKDGETFCCLPSAEAFTTDFDPAKSAGVYTGHHGSSLACPFQSMEEGAVGGTK